MSEERPRWARALKVLRLIRRWNRTQLARAAGLSVSAITRYEKGNRQPEDVHRLVSAMGYPRHLWERAQMFVASVDTKHADQTVADEGTLPARIDALVGDAGRWVDEVVREALTGALAAAGEATPRPRTPPSIGEALAILLVIRGWKRKDLAEAVGRSEETIANYEYGKTTPNLPMLRELLSALGLSFGAFERALQFVRVAQGARRLVAAGGHPGLSCQIEEVAARKVHRVEEFARRELNDLVVGAQILASRQAAPAARAALLACPDASRLELVRQVPELRTPGFCELLCEESLAAACDSAERARSLAKLAVAVAELAGGSASFHSRLLGYAGVHLANVERVAGRDLPGAGEMLERALAAWDIGAGADSGILNAARVCGLTASLRRAQRRLPEALAALDEGLAIDHWGETPNLLLAKARALIELGEFEVSIAQLREATSWIDGEQEPRKLFVVENLLVLNLCHLGQFEAAERRLPELRQLALTLRNRLDLLRVDWLASKIAGGLGQPDQALGLLLQVRRKFIALRNSYVAALTTLELAEMHSALGHAEEVKELARELAPFFEGQQVHSEAQRALTLLYKTAENELVGRGFRAS